MGRGSCRSWGGCGAGGHRRRALGVLALSVAAVSSVTVALDAAPARAGTPVPGAPGCPMFPSDNMTAGTC